MTRELKSDAFARRMQERRGTAPPAEPEPFFGIQSSPTGRLILGVDPGLGESTAVLISGKSSALIRGISVHQAIIDDPIRISSGHRHGKAHALRKMVEKWCETFPEAAAFLPTVAEPRTSPTFAEVEAQRQREARAERRRERETLCILASLARAIG